LEGRDVVKEPAFTVEDALSTGTRYNLCGLDTRSEERYDRLTWIAQSVFDGPVAIVSFVDTDRQWFKPCLGLDLNEIPRSISFCGQLSRR
jgi:hypothetical protein